MLIDLIRYPTGKTVTVVFNNYSTAKRVRMPFDPFGATLRTVLR